MFFNKEVDNLQRIRHYKSNHLIKPIAAYTINQDQCLLFPWAGGGNLVDYWRQYPHLPRDTESNQWLIEQFVGLSEALRELHLTNCRHGDLKPENILWFKSNSGMGTLQIADLGLAAFHKEEMHTKDRRGLKTVTPAGELRYGPPEMDKRRGADPRSRQYDMWSMGCIMLELLIWLMYGNDALKKFQQSTNTYFWERVDSHRIIYRVHTHVTACIDAMFADLCDWPVYKELLELISNHLLVVPVSEIYTSVPGCREIAGFLYHRLGEILEKGRSDFAGFALLRLKWPSRKIEEAKPRPAIVYKREGSLAAPPRIHIPMRSEPSLRSQSSQSAGRENSPKLVDLWDTVSDNHFATDLFKYLDWNTVKPDPDTMNSPSLCTNCSTVDLTCIFDADCDLSILKKRSLTCSLCRMLLDALVRENIKPPNLVQLSQSAGSVRIVDGPRLLSLYVDPNTESTGNVGQLGLPVLLDPSSQEHFTLLKEWIRACDASHGACRHDSSIEEDGTTQVLPTRLVEVGQTLRLVESSSISHITISTVRYVALSHCWGPLKSNERFCTYKHNLDDFKNSLNFDAMPRLFQDAVITARGLGVGYIWIDSLCIVQDDIDDWNFESVRMEQVFSHAYCTIGASAARSSLEGFLGPRPPRPCVQLRRPVHGGRGERIVYVCPDIDDFQRHVELGELNRRGWVLQERALSRRSIHYTSTQVYWECGAGVHCETLARLHNYKAALLSDANFPKSALVYYCDGRQVLMQDLYERYSDLAFTEPTDRSVAILGLQTRLARAFRTEAAHGLFAAYFARGLLWQARDDSQRMKRIVWPPDRRVPSWSWISKEGAIRYMELKFGSVSWATTADFKSPFSARHHRPKGERRRSTVDGVDLSTLKGLARRMHITTLEMLVRISFDGRSDFEVDELRCVIIGRDKVERSLDEANIYVLVIRLVSTGPDDEKVYERVGVASLLPKHVADEGVWVNIR
ncbi:hypothetical protein BX600DRAFT_522405 [Xylariales sp. PMI_506]|nr:hypothetical protein BX600DRAFT_522405 [Xylariales sp. PMI_506]